MSIRLASSLFTLSVLSILFPSNAHAESAEGAKAPPLASPTAPPTPSRSASSSRSQSRSQSISQSTSSLATTDDSTTLRFGIEGSKGIGFLFPYSSVGLRGELVRDHSVSVMARISHLNYSFADSFFHGGAWISTLGFRHYAGSLYAGIDGGAIFSLDQGDATPWLQGSFGVKVGPLDFGFTLSTPFDDDIVFTGLNAGVDLLSF